MKIEDLQLKSGTSLIDKGKRFSYQELFQKIEDFKNELNTEISEGEVLALISDYSFESIALFLALSQFPVIVVPIVPTTESELQSKLEAAKVNKILELVNDGLAVKSMADDDMTSMEKYQEITDKGNSGLVLFSSGTTGVPKVMVHDLSALLNSFVPPKKSRNLNFLLFLLFDHIGGINTLLGCLNNGSIITIPQDRNPENILQLIENEKVQILPTSPTFLNLMLMTENFGQYDLSSLKMITYGTERMPQSLLDKLKKKIPSVKFLQTFGTSETGILKTESKSSGSLYFKIVDPDYEFKIEDGQLFLKSKVQVNGYVNQDSSQFENGWFATGDLVETDEDGYLKVIGRLNKVINVGGQKVLPKEVEDLINQLDFVLDSTVYAGSNAITGQMVCADVVVTEEMDAKDAKKKILDICRNSLDKYKVPSKLKIKQELEFSNRFKKTNR